MMTTTEGISPAAGTGSAGTLTHNYEGPYVTAAATVTVGSGADRNLGQGRTSYYSFTSPGSLFMDAFSPLSSRLLACAAHSRLAWIHGRHVRSAVSAIRSYEISAYDSR
jgi:hypothetical protein